MAITPTYSWPLPDDTSLVKDGAEAIRDLGNAIDTTVSTTGLVHINTTTFSAVTSISVNNVFTSDYDNYKIKLVLDTQTASASQIRFRLRVAGADNSSAQYDYAGWIVRYAGTNSVWAGSNQTSVELNFSDTQTAIDFDVHNPNRLTLTQLVNIGSIANNGESWFGNAQHDTATVFDGFTFFRSANNFTGSVSVFGYRK